MKNNKGLPPDLLKDEIVKQTHALKLIRLWINIFLILSSVGILLVYLGATREPINYYMLVPGALIAALGIIAAIVFGYGHHNGKRNVEKMINVLEKQVKKSSKKSK